MPIVRNLRNIPPNIWIPIESNTFAKIIITADDGTDYTIMNTYSGSADENFCISAKVTRVVTDQIGSFDFRIVNDEGMFYGLFDGGETVKVYTDYTDATTLIFRGKIDNVKYGLNTTDGFYIDIDGREFPEFIDRTITGIQTSALAYESLAIILDTYFSNIKLQFWNGSIWAIARYNPLDTPIVKFYDAPVGGNETGYGDFPVTEEDLINISYQHKKAWSVITEICNRVGLDCYSEYDTSTAQWYLRTFLKQDITNDVGVAYGINLINLGEFGVDTTEIYNRAIVYGKTESDNILLLKTEDDTNSQSEFWIKDKVLNESDLSSMNDVQGKATYEIGKGIETTPTGRIECICVPTFKPGQLIPISIPYCGINGYYKIQSFTHDFGNVHTTNIEVSKKIRTLKDLFIPKVNSEEVVSGLDNPNDMRDSYTIYFDADENLVTKTDTEETADGKLRLVSGKDTGYFITDTKDVNYDVTECELRKYDALGAGDEDVYYVSNNGGTTWEEYLVMSTINTHTFNVPGNRLAVKVVLNRNATTGASPTYESIALLYK